MRASIRWGIAIALLGWLHSSGRLSGFGMLRNTWGLDFGLATLFQFGVFLLPVLRFHFLLRTVRLEPSIVESLHVGASGYFASLFIPASLGVDAVRVAHFSRRYPAAVSKVVWANVVDRVFGLVGLLVVALGFGAAFVARGDVAESAAVVRWLMWVGGAAALVGALALAGSFGTGLLDRHPRMAEVVRVGRSFFHRPVATIVASLLTLAGHLSSILAALFAFRALQATAPVFEVFAVTPLVNLTYMVPIAPLSLGIADSAASVLFEAVGIARGADMTMVVRLITVAGSLLCGVGALVSMSRYSLIEPSESGL